MMQYIFFVLFWGYGNFSSIQLILLFSCTYYVILNYSGMDIFCTVGKGIFQYVLEIDISNTWL